jgi:hypothetical protein
MKRLKQKSSKQNSKEACKDNTNKIGSKTALRHQNIKTN